MICCVKKKDRSLFSVPPLLGLGSQVTKADTKKETYMHAASACELSCNCSPVYCTVVISYGEGRDRESASYILLLYQQNGKFRRTRMGPTVGSASDRKTNEAKGTITPSIISCDKGAATCNPIEPQQALLKVASPTRSRFALTRSRLPGGIGSRPNQKPKPYNLAPKT